MDARRGRNTRTTQFFLKNHWNWPWQSATQMKLTVKSRDFSENDPPFKILEICTVEQYTLVLYSGIINSKSWGLTFIVFCNETPPFWLHILHLISQWVRVIVDSNCAGGWGKVTEQMRGSLSMTGVISLLVSRLRNWLKVYCHCFQQCSPASFSNRRIEYQIFLFETMLDA
jgi:hypothetical protein